MLARFRVALPERKGVGSPVALPTRPAQQPGGQRYRGVLAADPDWSAVASGEAAIASAIVARIAVTSRLEGIARIISVTSSPCVMRASVRPAPNGPVTARQRPANARELAPG
jgi:hypothetical protein